MSGKQQALPPIEDLEESLELDVQLPLELPPLDIISAPSPALLGSSTQINEGSIAAITSGVVGRAKANKTTISIHGSKEIQIIPPGVDLVNPGNNARNDLIQLPKPTTSSRAAINPPAFPAIPLLSNLRKPPPGAALFPPITPSNALSDTELFTPDSLVQVELDETVGGRPLHTAERPTGKRRPCQSRGGSWTEQETGGLVKGIEIYGAGHWKLISKDKKLRINPQRSAADLKDRYREIQRKHLTKQRKAAARVERERSLNAVRAEKAKQKLALAKSGDHLTDPAGTQYSISTIDDVKEEIENQKHNDALKQESNQHLQRFVRWTQEEDELLMKGIRKHGIKWTKMVRDEHLGLKHKTAVQLRDRYRNMDIKSYSARKSLVATSNAANRKASRKDAVKGVSDGGIVKLKSNIEWLLTDNPAGQSVLSSGDSTTTISKSTGANVTGFETNTSFPTAQSMQQTSSISVTLDPISFPSESTDAIIDSTMASIPQIDLAFAPLDLSSGNDGPSLDEIEMETRNPNIEEILNDDFEPLSQLPPLKFPFDQDWSGDVYDDSLTLAPLNLWSNYDFTTGQWGGSMGA